MMENPFLGCRVNDAVRGAMIKRVITFLTVGLHPKRQQLLNGQNIAEALHHRGERGGLKGVERRLFKSGTD